MDGPGKETSGCPTACQETKLENKALRGAIADFERVKRAFGPEEVERAVEDAKRREAQEREQKKAKRRFRRGAR